ARSPAAGDGQVIAGGSAEQLLNDASLADEVSDAAVAFRDVIPVLTDRAAGFGGFVAIRPPAWYSRVTCAENRSPRPSRRNRHGEASRPVVKPPGRSPWRVRRGTGGSVLLAGTGVRSWLD